MNIIYKLSILLAAFGGLAVGYGIATGAIMVTIFGIIAVSLFFYVAIKNEENSENGDGANGE